MDRGPEVRKSNGQFGPGNKTGGRKTRTDEEDVRALFRSVVTLPHQRAIIVKAIAQAEKGDQAARKFLFDYLYGPPVQRNEHTGADGGAIVIEWSEAVGDKD